MSRRVSTGSRAVQTQVAPTFRVPANACDSHVHIFAPPDRFPLRDTALTVPTDATADVYVDIQRRLGLSRAVVVQSAAYAKDLSCMLDALRRVDNRWKGIALLDDDISDSKLADLDRCGIVGARLNFVTGVGNVETLRGLSATFAGTGWHIEVLIRLDDLHRLRHQFARADVPVVIDHLGYTRASEALGHPGLDTLAELMRDGPLWSKISGIDRIGNREEGYEDARRVTSRLIQANPERLVWGSDWPHVMRRVAVDDGFLLNLLSSWIDDQALRDRILVANAATLYRFS